jgi:hypothetical protein
MSLLVLFTGMIGNGDGTLHQIFALEDRPLGYLALAVTKWLRGLDSHQDLFA